MHVKCLPQANISEHLVPSHWLCSGKVVKLMMQGQGQRSLEAHPSLHHPSSCVSHSEDCGHEARGF